ncbi:MAG TPA: cytosine deaminase [Methylomirabilota bacterium]|jgi:cytosine deaminase|nr:cytosine deaminase [Methylomirabilota bacterium]
MTAGFVTVPGGNAYWLRNATVPAALLTDLPAGAQVSPDGLVVVDLAIRDARIATVVTAGGTRDDLRKSEPGDAPGARDGSVDLQRGQVWPCLIDVHTHLDKGHTWERAPNPDGTFDGAIRTVTADRTAHWSAEDVRRRMDFGLRCSFTHGTKAVRTHLDSLGAQAAITWPVFEGLRKEWAGHVELQAVSLVPLHVFGTQEGEELADRVAAAGGILGAVGYMSPEIDALFDRMLDLAAERGLDVDLHCDESGDVGARALSHLARAVLRRRFAGRVACGHCCSLAVQPPDVVAETLDLVVEAGISVISLPMCNLYLQDRVPGRTPRWRGVTLLHEFAARRVRVAVASDNCRDAFHGFGDHDMLEVFREATRICHLDRPYGDWPRAVTTTPAELMGLAGGGRVGPGLPADLVLFEGRTWSELLSRPQANRVVLRNGTAIERRLPDYRELDDLLGVRTGA